MCSCRRAGEGGSLPTARSRSPRAPRGARVRGQSGVVFPPLRSGAGAVVARESCRVRTPVASRGFSIQITVVQP
jgi:hypothetical protein